VQSLNLIDKLRQLEEQMLAPEAGRSEHFKELLADEFVEIGSSGRVYDKIQTIAALEAAIPCTVTASDFQLMSLAPDLVLLFYRACRHSVPAVHSLRSSIWRQQNGQWRITFHQGTLSSGPKAEP
jgi:hypothetical protein